MTGSSSGITSYPTKAGIYRITGSNVGFPFSTYNYGTLIITSSGYINHIFVDSTSQKIWYSIGADSVSCPSTWWELTRTITNTPTLDNSNGYFSSSQIRYSKSGTTVTVYFSVKTAQALGEKKTITLSNLPSAWAQQNCIVTMAYDRGDVELHITETTATLCNLSEIPSGVWMRCVFSYISAD